MADYSRMSDSPAPETKEADSKKISFRFCRDSNMLYPKEDRTTNTLLFACRTCNYAENAGASCIYRNSLKETIAETPGNVQDVAQDPTVGRLKTPMSTTKRSLSRTGYGYGGRSRGEEEEEEEEEEDDDDVLMGEDGEEEEQIEDSMGVDMLPQMCTLCGQEIVCPICEGPTDAGVMLEADDPEVEAGKKGQDLVEAEKRERTMSSAGL